MYEINDNVSGAHKLLRCLKRKGFFIKQATHEEEIRDLLTKEKVTFYIGFDPTGGFTACRTLHADYNHDVYAEIRS